MDGRARVRISPEQLKATHREEHSNPTDDGQALILETGDSTITLAADDAGAWSRMLDDWRTGVLDDRGTAPLEESTRSDSNRAERAEEGAAS